MVFIKVRGRIGMKCPGQDSRYWGKDSIFEEKCPKCGNSVEFFKDEPYRICKRCGHKFFNPRLDFGCAAYCKFAEQCLGNLPPELLSQKRDLLKERVGIEMKRHFQRDFKRIGHAIKVARYAEEIAKKEKADLPVVIIAGYLHDVGLRDFPPDLHEEKGGEVAEEILKRIGADDELIDKVKRIVSSHHKRPDDHDLEKQCVYDADLIVNLGDDFQKGKIDRDQLERAISERFLTQTGRELARSILIEGEK